MYALPHMIDRAPASPCHVPVVGFNLADSSTLREYPYNSMITHLQEDLGELMLGNNCVGDTGVCCLTCFLSISCRAAEKAAVMLSCCQAQ